MKLSNLEQQIFDLVSRIAKKRGVAEKMAAKMLNQQRASGFTLDEAAKNLLSTCICDGIYGCYICQPL